MLVVEGHWGNKLPRQNQGKNTGWYEVCEFVSNIFARNTRVGSRVQVRYRVARQQSGWKLVGYLHRIRQGACFQMLWAFATSTGIEKCHALKRIFEYPNSYFDRCFSILSNWVSAIWHCHRLSLTKTIAKPTEPPNQKNRTTPEDAKTKWDVVN